MNENPNQGATFGVTSLSGLTKKEFEGMLGLIDSTSTTEPVLSKITH